VIATFSYVRQPVQLKNLKFKKVFLFYITLSNLADLFILTLVLVLVVTDVFVNVYVAEYISTLENA